MVKRPENFSALFLRPSVLGLFSENSPKKDLAGFLLPAEKVFQLLWQKQLAQTLAGLKDATRSFEQAVQRGQVYRTHPSREGSFLECVLS